MSGRWGVYANGRKLHEFDDEDLAMLCMARLVEEITPDDPTASFDVMPVGKDEPQ